jgi:hypothetical protein
MLLLWPTKIGIIIAGRGLSVKPFPLPALIPVGMADEGGFFCEAVLAALKGPVA